MKFILRDLSSPSNAERAKASLSDYFEGYGSPEGVITANMGAIYISLNGGTNSTLFLKESGFNTNTGWIAAGSGGSGWQNEQLFAATESQIDFTVSNFTFDANTKITVLKNGVDQDEGGSLDWVRNVALNKITFNDTSFLDARIKVKKW